MTTLPDFAYDPADMGAMRAKLVRLPEALSFPHFELDRVEIGPEALRTLPTILSGLTAATGPLILVQDATPSDAQPVLQRGPAPIPTLVRRGFTDRVFTRMHELTESVRLRT